jgi:sporulation-control protein spo0M
MFERMKHFFGIGGVNIELHLPEAVRADGDTLEGLAKLSTGSEVHILSVTIKMIEQFIMKGANDEKTLTEKEHGQVAFNEPFRLKVGEVKEIPFKMSYRIPEREEKTNEAGLLVHRTGDYFVLVFVDVQETPTLFDPANHVTIRVE